MKTTSLSTFRDQIAEVKKAKRNKKIEMLKSNDPKVVKVRILAKGWEAEKIIRNLKSTTECFDVKSEDISKNEIKFICETDSIVEFVKELCSNESIFWTWKGIDYCLFSFYIIRKFFKLHILCH